MKITSTVRKALCKIDNQLADLSADERLSVAIALLGYELASANAPSSEASLRLVQTLLEEYKGEIQRSHHPLFTLGNEDRADYLKLVWPGTAAN